MTLEEELDQVKAENAALKAQVALLSERVAQLEALLSQNNRNSSKPPSSDGFKRPPKKGSDKKPSNKKAGGQVGHKGQTLSWNEQRDGNGKGIDLDPPAFCKLFLSGIVRLKLCDGPPQRIGLKAKATTIGERHDGGMTRFGIKSDLSDLAGRIDGFNGIDTILVVNDLR